MDFDTVVSDIMKNHKHTQVWYPSYDDELPDKLAIATIVKTEDAWNESAEDDDNLNVVINDYTYDAAHELLDEYSRTLTEEDQEWFDNNKDGILDAVRELILDADDTDYTQELARNTPDVFVSAILISEDDTRPGEDLESTAAFISRETGLDEAKVLNLLHSVPSDLYMVQVVANITVEEAYKSNSPTFTFKNPDIVIGNVFTGAYWSDQFNGEIVVERSQLTQDRWGVNKCYGRFMTSTKVVY